MPASGALSAPHRRGGGAAFGPTPRDYAVKVNRKARRRALRAALSVHAARGSVAVLDGASFDPPATKQAAEALDDWGPTGPTLVVLDAEEVAALKSFRNIPGVTVLAGRPRRASRTSSATLPWPSPRRLWTC